MAAHFFLSDELRLTPADRLALFRGDRLRIGAYLANPELAIPHEGDVTPLATERRIEFTFLGIRQPHHIAAQARKIEVTVERDQHARTIFGPLIIDNARSNFGDGVLI